MDINEFQFELETRLSNLDFVDKWEITKKRTTVRIRVYLKKKSLLNVFYNMMLRIQSFALIIDQKRVWGLDRDNKFGWHEHTIENPTKHESIEPHNIEQIISKLKIAWARLDMK